MPTLKIHSRSPDTHRKKDVSKEIIQENEILKERIKELEKENERLRCREFEMQVNSNSINNRSASDSQLVQDVLQQQQQQATVEEVHNNNTEDEQAVLIRHLLATQPKRIRKIQTLTLQNQDLQQLVQQQQENIENLRAQVQCQDQQIGALHQALQQERHQQLTTGPRRIRQIHRLLEEAATNQQQPTTTIAAADSNATPAPTADATQ